MFSDLHEIKREIVKFLSMFCSKTLVNHPEYRKKI